MQPGDRIGPYELLQELGRGGMGVVYRARHAELGHEVALKVLPAGSATEEMRRRFRREAQAAARLADHPNIAGVHASGEDDGHSWLAMELVEGEGLEQRLAEGPLPWSLVRPIAEQLVAAAAHAHQAGVLHRDIKPANAVIDSAGTLRLLDFGLAAPLDLDPEATRLTQSGTLLGTPAYMAPEQIRGGTVDARADVYAIGASLFELLTGAPPFVSGSMHALLRQVLEAEPPSMRSVGADVPPAVEAVVRACLAKDPADRPVDAAQLAEWLAQAADGTRVRFGPSAGTRSARAVRRRGPVLAVAGVLAVVTIVAVAAIRGANRTQEQQSRKITTTTQERSLAELAAEYSGAHAMLTQQAGGALRVLLDRVCGAAVTPDALDTALAEIRTAAAATHARHPDSRLPAVWEEWSARIADRSTDPAPAFAARLEAESRDPYPDLLLARIALLRYAAQARVGRVDSTEQTAVTAPEEDADLRDARTAAMQLAQRATERAAWSSVAAGEGTRRFVAGVQAFAAEEWESCLAPLHDAASEPELEAERRVLLGLALFQLGRYAEAADALEAPARRGWHVALVHAGLASMIAAKRGAKSRAERRAGFARAVAHLERAQQQQDTSDDINSILASAHLFLSKSEPNAAAARVQLDAAIAQARRGLALQNARNAPPEHRLVIHTTLGRALAGRAALEDATPADCTRDVRAALALLDRVLAAEPGRRYVRFERAKAGALLYRRGAVPLAQRAGRLQQSAADYAQVIAEGLTAPQAFVDRVKVLIDLGLVLRGRADGPRALRRAVTEAGSYLERFPKLLDLRLARAQAAVELSQVLGRQGTSEPELIRDAMADVEAVLAKRPDDTGARFTAALAHREAGRAAQAADASPDAAFAAAAQSVERVIAGRPDWTRPYRFRAWMHEEWGKLEASERFFAAGVARFPKDPFLVNGLKRVRSKLGK